jgi:hypothetical protein
MPECVGFAQAEASCEPNLSGRPSRPFLSKNLVMPSAFIWAALAVVAIWTVGVVLDRRNRRTRLRVLRSEWGAPRARDRNMAAIAAYARGISSSATVLDDRTWSDMNMDDVYSVLDRTESVVGQQVLYARLRSGRKSEHLGAFEALVATQPRTSRPENAPNSH